MSIENVLMIPQARQIYVPLPEYESRLYLLKRVLSKEKNSITEAQMADLAQKTKSTVDALVVDTFHVFISLSVLSLSRRALW